jgi:hypothetical protein
MSDRARETVRTIARQLVLRVALLFLRVGLSFGDFEQLSRRAFCIAAERQLRLQGGRVTTSRVAVTTGLSRAEVSRLRRGRLENESRVHYKPRTERVLYGWRADSDFTDSRGEPRNLPRRGRGSIEDLVKRYSGDIPPRALIEELLAAGAVRRNPDASFAPIRREFEQRLPVGIDADAAAAALNHVFDALIDRPAESQTRRLSVTFPASRVPPHILRTCHERIDRFLSALSHYLHSSALTSSKGPSSSDQSTYELLIVDAQGSAANEQERDI